MMVSGDAKISNRVGPVCGQWFLERAKHFIIYKPVGVQPHRTYPNRSIHLSDDLSLTPLKLRRVKPKKNFKLHVVSYLR